MDAPDKVEIENKITRVQIMFELNPLKLVNIFFIPVSLHQAEDMTLLRLPGFFYSETAKND